jgi:hypothetical protein
MRIQTLAVVCAAVAMALPPAVAAVAPPGAAPDFALELFSGRTFRLADARGTAVILLFWAPW